MAVDVTHDWSACDGPVAPDVRCEGTEEPYEGDHCQCWRENLDVCCYCGESYEQEGDE